ncbi:MAG: hypothetical protein ACRDD1_01290, partial [Planctomycetia bacterium]
TGLRLAEVESLTADPSRSPTEVTKARQSLDELIERQLDLLPLLADELNQRYLSHAEASRQVTNGRAESVP